MLKIRDIYGILPHRFPFLMVDRIVSHEKENKVVGLKNVTVNEPYFQGHFPDEPVMPAVMIIETMAQIGGFLFDMPGKRGFVISVNKAKFKRMVIPGDQLIIECSVVVHLGNKATINAVAKVDDKVVASAELAYNFVDVNESDE